MHEVFVELVAKLTARWPDDAKQYVQPPCPEVELMALRGRVGQLLGTSLPAEYEEFLRRSDGVTIGALAVFGSKQRTRPDRWGEPLLYLDGIVEGNQARRPDEQMDEVLIMAEDDGCMYGLNLVDGTYGRWDLVAREQEVQYRSFDDMLSQILREAIMSLPEQELADVEVPEV